MRDDKIQLVWMTQTELIEMSRTIEDVRQYDNSKRDVLLSLVNDKITSRIITKYDKSKSEERLQRMERPITNNINTIA